MLSCAGGSLDLVLPDGQRLTRHPIWLRERLPDPRITDPTTGQRLIEAAELPLDLTITDAHLADGQVSLVFSDGFEAAVPLAWFAGSQDRAEDDFTDDIILWDSGLNPLPFMDFDTLRRSDTALAAFLDTLHAHGFAVVRGVPVEMDGALDFAALIGPIRQTNWGGLADVKAIANAYDLTMTPRHLEPHSDNPYRNPIPGYILLHCLINDAVGGSSTVVDGFHAAKHLKEQDPAAFASLTRTEVKFRYADADTVLENRGSLIELDDLGRIVRTRYSNRTENVAPAPVAELDAFYRARQAFYSLIQKDSALTLTFKLEPGDLMMMDNYRLFHGRTAYRLETGSRHMRQCYMDRDVVQSRRSVLRTQTTSKELAS
ncbi:TauD/TfdA family dioxygenase [Acidisoma cladoniae]|uniref:TauD/TfdA family dioxygenase n=1 Tax=Acidisoma cladoniae TaxID=3040935 RepID=UPI00254E6D9F|nr:TauD/TfdA family dioxygenase [Acidisoma sp. PAMC 29798]